MLLILDQIIKLYPNTNLRFLLFASKHYCEQRVLTVNNEPGKSFFLDKSNFAINPFSQIKNVDYKLVLADAARVLAIECGLMAGSQLYILINMFDFLSKDKNENLIGFIKWLSEKNEHSLDKKGYQARSLNRLQPIMLEIGNIFDFHTGISDEVWITENIIIELPTSSSSITAMVSGLILARMFRYKSVNREYMKYILDYS